MSMIYRRLTWLFACSLLLLASTAQATDAEKEKRWADQLKDNLVVGEPVWLEAGGQKFFAIYTEQSQDKPKGAVVLMHGIGVHPDWNDVIAPLRSNLPDMGWHTLSIQMPILHNEAKPEEYAPLFEAVPARLDAAVAFLQSRDIKHMVLVGHSMGAAMGTYYLARKGKQTPFSSYVGIGLSAPKDADERMRIRVFLEKLTIPMLDLYGSQDLPQVLDTRDARRRALQKAGVHFRQDEVPGANHFFIGMDSDLVRRVRSWIENGNNHARPGKKETEEGQTDNPPATKS